MAAASTIQQVAKLFLILGEEIAAQLIQRLPKETARKVLRSLSQLGPVSEAEIASVKRPTCCLTTPKLL